MSPIQEQLIELVRNQPEDATWDELLEKVFVQRMVDEGLQDVREGRVVSNQDAQSRIRAWH